MQFLILQTIIAPLRRSFPKVAQNSRSYYTIANRKQTVVLGARARARAVICPLPGVGSHGNKCSQHQSAARFRSRTQGTQGDTSSASASAIRSFSTKSNSASTLETPTPTNTEAAAAMAHPKITAENIYQLFPEIEQQRNTSAAAVGTELQGYDATQVSLMDEVCIVLDDDDKPIAGASKKICHLMTNIERGLLHRAFSVFLFDSEKRLLLQQRADEKITFAGMWTNTCCSHPLDIPTETGVSLEEGIVGVKNAAQRKLEQELGIPAAQVPPEIFKFLTRIHYKAPSNGPWGEHEIDYILFAQATVDLAVNPNEAKDVRYVTPQELKAMFQDPELTFTPWFRLICETMLFEWWENFETLDKYLGEKEIRRM